MQYTNEYHAHCNLKWINRHFQVDNNLCVSFLYLYLARHSDLTGFIGVVSVSYSLIVQIDKCNTLSVHCFEKQAFEGFNLKIVQVKLSPIFSLSGLS